MVKTLFVGDVLINSSNNIEYESELKHLFDGADIKCCNFEGPVITADDVPITKMGPNIYQDSSAPQLVKRLDFNLICMANNHICDYGYEAMMQTKKCFGSTKVIGCGDSLDTIYDAYVYKKDGISIGFINIAERQFGSTGDDNNVGYAWAFHSNVKRQLELMKDECDYTVVIIHAGLEDVKLPIPEWREYYKHLIECGANVVVGHHSHVVQGYERYGNGLIFYSLGNYIWQNNSYSGQHSVVLELDFVKNGEIDFYFHYVDCDDFSMKLVSENVCKENILYCNSILKDDSEYIKTINRLCIEAYNDYYKSFYYFGVFLTGKNKLFNRIKDALKIVLKGYRENYPVLWHNISIETHVWVVRRALNLFMQNQNKKRENRI